MLNWLVCTPGENEWTDCHRSGRDPLDRLAYLHRVMFAGDAALGRTTMRVERQSRDAYYAKYVENARWERAGIVFGTPHIVGRNNNLSDEAAARPEFTERNGANLAWIDVVFERAREFDAHAVVLMFQADFTLRTPGLPYGFSDVISRISVRASEFGKPVLIVHGDGHRLLIDQPFDPGGRRLDTVTRLMVFGDADVHGVLITADTGKPEVFSYTPVVIPQNLR